MKLSNIDRKKLIDEIKKLVSKYDIIDIAYIFGSFIKEEDFNDIDIALIISKKLKPYERYKFKMMIARKLEEQVKPRIEFDVKLLNYSPIEFQYEVIKTGKPIFIRNKDIEVEYESKVIIDYLDFKDTIKIVDKKFLARDI